MKPILEGVRKGHLIVCGMTRYGKTTFALWLFLLDDLFDRRKNSTVIFVDTKHDDTLLAHGMLIDEGTLADSIGELRFHLDMKAKHIIYRPPGTYERGKHLTALINTLFEYREKPKHRGCPYGVFIDEVHMYSSKSGRQEGLERLSTTGAGKDIHAVIIGQRLQDIHEQTLSQCNTRVVFFMQERPEYLRSRVMTDLISWMGWLKDHPYYFAFQTSADWHLHVPVPPMIDPYGRGFSPPSDVGR
jgi:hypothetical protein